MLLMKAKHTGYILLESLFSLAIVSFILLLLVPLTVFMETKKKENQARLEMYRYFSELAEAYRHQVPLTFHSKEVAGLSIAASARQTAEQLTELVLEMDGEKIEIIWLWETEE